MRLVERGRLFGIAEGVGVPAGGSPAVAAEWARDLAGAVEIGADLDGEVRDLILLADRGEAWLGGGGSGWSCDGRCRIGLDDEGGEGRDGLACPAGVCVAEDAGGDLAGSGVGAPGHEALERFEDLG